MNKGCFLAGLFFGSILLLIFCYITNSTNAVFIFGGFIGLLFSIVASLIPSKKRGVDYDRYNS